MKVRALLMFPSLAETKKGILKNRSRVCIWCKQAFSKGTWPLVIAKIELDLHLACHKTARLCQHPCSPLHSALSSLCLSSLPSSPPSYTITNDTENNWKACSVRHKTSNLLFKRGMGKGRETDRRESEKEKWGGGEGRFFPLFLLPELLIDMTVWFSGLWCEAA